MATLKNMMSRTFLGDPWIRYSVALVIIYASLFNLRLYYSELIMLPYISTLHLEQIYPVFLSKDDIILNRSFVEWFGVLYGFLLPLILVKAWEQFETLESEFDREADSLKVFAEDVMLLPKNFKDKKIKFILLAIEYVKHAQEKYVNETFEENEAKKNGDSLLNRLRNEMSFFFTSVTTTKNISPLISQLLKQLNVIIDVRGDRISNSKQRLFPGLRFVAVLTSYVFLIPFYFLDYEMGLFGDGLVLAVTILIVFVLHTIEDLDEPFYKKWRLHTDNWKILEENLQIHLRNLM